MDGQHKSWCTLTTTPWHWAQPQKLSRLSVRESHENNFQNNNSTTNPSSHALPKTCTHRAKLKIALLKYMHVQITGNIHFPLVRMTPFFPTGQALALQNFFSNSKKNKFGKISAHKHYVYMYLIYQCIHKLELVKMTWPLAQWWFHVPRILKCLIVNISALTSLHQDKFMLHTHKDTHTKVI